MRPDDIHSLEDLASVLGEDPRFAGYELLVVEPGAVEVRVGDTGLVLLDERVFADRARLDAHLARARAGLGSGRLVLLGTDDKLADAARHGDSNDLSLHVLPMSRARAALLLP